jgi:hypothetical protein
MATLTHKIQLLLDDHQHRALLTLAKTQGKTLSALLREAVVEQLLKEARRTARQKAFEEISAMTLPVADWPEMEKEIERAHAGGRKRP